MSGHGLAQEAIVVDSRWSFDGGRDAVRYFADLAATPTAVLAGADIAALGMMDALWDIGQSVPEAYSLVGYDNSRTSSLGPIRLTTVDQAGAEMGRRVGRLLLERIEGRSMACHDVLVPRLVLRGTTARIG